MESILGMWKVGLFREKKEKRKERRNKEGKKKERKKERKNVGE